MFGFSSFAQTPFASLAGAVEQPLTQNTRYDNTNTFYSATVTAGAVTLLPARYDNTNTFYAASLSASITLLPARYDNTNTFYGPTIVRGSVDLAPPLYNNINNFYSPVISQATGTQTLLPSMFTNANTFYSPTVVSGKILLAGGGGGEDHSRTGPINPRRKVKKHGFANERAQQEAALAARFTKPVEILTDSGLPAARQTAKKLSAYLNDKGTADALQKQLDRLQAELSIKASNDENQNRLNEELKIAANQIQEMLADEQDAIDLLMLVEREDSILLMQAIGF